MSGKTKALGYSDIQTVFSKFWNVFLDVTAKAQLAVAPKQLPFKIELSKGGGSASVSLASPLHMKNWPYKAASGANSLHLLVNGTETINLSSHKTIKSCVQVVYYQEKPQASKTLVPIEAIHYDYQAVPAHAHPLFHAQFCRDATEPEEQALVETLRDFNLENDLFGERYGHLKIPTAHMNLVSVLMCLCADHIPSSVSAALLLRLFTEVAGISAMPTAEATSLTKGIDNNKSYCSMHWYVT